MSTARTGDGTRRTTKPRATAATKTTTGSKTTAAAKTTAPRQRARSAADIAVSTEERQRMIREAAYYRAEQRGFTSGDAMADWLAAEAEVNALLEK